MINERGERICDKCQGEIKGLEPRASIGNRDYHMRHWNEAEDRELVRKRKEEGGA